MSGPSPERGLLDTSVVIALGSIDVERLPLDSAVSALTFAELAVGPVSTSDAARRAKRVERLQRAEATFESLSFDQRCARAYGRVCAAILTVGRKPRGTHAVDLMIAATALANDLPLYTLNASDLRGLEGLIEVVDLG